MLDQSQFLRGKNAKVPHRICIIYNPKIFGCSKNESGIVLIKGENILKKLTSKHSKRRLYIKFRI